MLRANTKPKAEFNIYIEWKRENEDLYSLHISLQTRQKAEELFLLMRDRWMLPVSFLDDRIILAPTADYTLPGVLCQQSTLYIVFTKDSPHAHEFYKLIQPMWHDDYIKTKLPEPMVSYLGDKVYFSKLIHTNFSIEKRIKSRNEIINYFMLLTAALEMMAYPKDIIFLINKIILTIKPTIFKTNYIDHLIDINQKFLLPQYPSDVIAIQKYKKISCNLMYSISNVKDPDNKNKHLIYLHLVCSDSNDAAILANQMQDAELNMYFQRNENEITIYPQVLYKLNGVGLQVASNTTRDNKIEFDRIGIRFNDTFKVDIFLDLVNLKECNNITHFEYHDEIGIYFPIESIPLKIDHSTDMFSNTHEENKISEKIKQVHRFINDKILNHLNKGFTTSFINMQCSLFQNLKSLFPDQYEEVNEKKYTTFHKINAVEYLKRMISIGLSVNIPVKVIVSTWLMRYENTIYQDRDGNKQISTATSDLVNELLKTFDEEECVQGMQLKF